MDDGELDFSNNALFSGPQMGDLELPCSCSMDSLFDDILKDTHACTHTHTCNPPGPDFTHTHTCFHAHTKILAAPSDDKAATTDDTAESNEKCSKKRPQGNREAVRKYREKKKARAASLEDEVARLKSINHHLVKKLQGQAALEAEAARLKCLLVDIRGRIEGEIGSFPYQKTGRGVDGISNAAHPLNLSGGSAVNCDIRCNKQIYCVYPGMDGMDGQPRGMNSQGFGFCDAEKVQCADYSRLGSKESLGCSADDNDTPAFVPAPCMSAAGKRKGVSSSKGAEDCSI